MKLTRIPSFGSSRSTRRTVIRSPRTKSRLKSDTVSSILIPSVKTTFVSVCRPQLPSSCPGTASQSQGLSPTTILGAEPMRFFSRPISGNVTENSIEMLEAETGRFPPVGESNEAKGLRDWSTREVTKSEIGRLHWNKDGEESELTFLPNSFAMFRIDSMISGVWWPETTDLMRFSLNCATRISRSTPSLRVCTSSSSAELALDRVVRSTADPPSSFIGAFSASFPRLTDTQV